MSKLGRIFKARATAWAAQRQEEETARSDLHDDLLGIHASTGTFIIPREGGLRRSPLVDEEDMDTAELAQQVTLVVYGWHNVQPGPLSWVFPSLGQAISAAKAMRNAVSWAVVKGRQTAEMLDSARLRGAVLLEHAG